LFTRIANSGLKLSLNPGKTYAEDVFLEKVRWQLGSIAISILQGIASGDHSQPVETRFGITTEELQFLKGLKDTNAPLAGSGL
jgi:hypothetical protein